MIFRCFGNFGIVLGHSRFEEVGGYTKSPKAIKS
jgi:hypothetical protein